MFRQRKLRGTKRKADYVGRVTKRARRSFRRRFRGRRRGGNRPRLLKVPVSERTLVKLHYFEMVEVAPPVGGYAQYQWRSSCHDPNFSGTGHQPLWWDQYKYLYRKYRVYGIKYAIRCVNDRESSTLVCVNLTPTSYIASSSMQAEIERSSCRGYAVTQKYGNHDQKIFKGYMNVAKIAGLSRTEFGGHEAFEAGVEANPAEDTRITLSYMSTDSASGRMLIYAKLVYYVEMFDKVSVGMS